MFRRSRASVLGAVAVATILVQACAPPAAVPSTSPAPSISVAPDGSQAPTQPPIAFLNLSIAGSAGFGSPQLVAEQRGFYTKYSLEVDQINIDGEANANAALQTGGVQIASGGLTGNIRSLAAGSKQTALGCNINVPSDYFVSAAAITALADLKGKKIGISQFGSTSHYISTKVVEGAGLDPEADVTFIQVGSDSARMAALQSGAIDAGLTAGGTDKALAELGFNILSKTNSIGVKSSNNCYMVLTDWLGVPQNRDTMKRFMMALMESVHYMKTNKEGTLPVMSSWMGQRDMEVVEDVYDFIIDDIPRDLRADPEAVTQDIAFVALQNPDAANLDPAIVVDNSIIDEIIASGFLDNLYASD